MENTDSSKSFVKSVVASLLVMMTITASLGYVLDPNLYYRIPNYHTYISEPYTTAGLLKNYPAEIAVIGSSMMQNTNMDFVKEKLRMEPVKYTRSGMNVDETSMLIDRATSIESNKVKRFLVSIDMTQFNTVKGSPYKKYPEYLYDDVALNDIKYLLGFETWTKFIPFDVIYNIASNIDSKISSKIVKNSINVTDLKLMGSWSDGTSPQAVFGEKIVKNKYKNNLESPAKQSVDGMSDRMKSRFDNDFYPIIEKHKDKEFTFILPPYSALYWQDSEKNGYANTLFDFKKYMVTRFSQLNNVVIYDFQDYKEIADLNNYKDTTHYVPRFNDMMIESIAEAKNIIHMGNMDQRVSNLKHIVDQFEVMNMDWLKQVEK